MDKAIINHRLDLVISLLDTTTGFAIEERNVSFKSEGEAIPFMYKGNGMYIFLDTKRTSTTIEIDVTGFEKEEIFVEYEESTRYLNIILNMVPKITSKTYAGLIDMEGTLQGLQSIDAVEFRRHVRSFQSFQPRNNQMKFFGGGELTEKNYAVVLEKAAEFEEFTVKKKIDKFSVSLEKALTKEIPVGSPITRIVRGKTFPDGRYILRVRDDGEELTYLLRYVVEGNVKFKIIDFKNDEERKID